MNIALIAHDSRKRELLEWVEYNHEILCKHNLYATGTTGKFIEEDLINVQEYDQFTDTDYLHSIQPFKGKITRLLSGPLGGDSQVGAMIAEGKIDVLIFFCDNLIIQGHNSDIQGLTRLASLYNIAFATNRTTADMILTSPLLNDPNYKRKSPNFNNYTSRELNV